MAKLEIYLETGNKKVIAGAVEWPGWCRVGRDEESALGALAEYGVRYGRVAHTAQLEFKSPVDASTFEVVERLKGGATTDFGAPEAVPSRDEEPFGEDDLRRSRALFHAAWRAFDDAVAAARGRTLATGPRGGGRQLDGIIEHLIGSDASYLGQLGHKHKVDEHLTVERQLAALRAAIIDGLEAAARGEIAERGPRGGMRWPARYYVRRALWHVLDHVWEIEDRVSG